GGETVGSGVTAGLGDGVASGVGDAVGAVVPAGASNAPISQTAIPSPSPSTGRATPRWSVAGQAALSPASIAGLPGSRACVLVGPPLSANGPSSGSVSVMSPPALNGQVLSLLILWPAEIADSRSGLVSAQLVSPLPATTLLMTVTVGKLTWFGSGPLPLKMPSLLALTVTF